MPDDRGIVISFARMTKFLATDIPNQRITVEAGVINAHVTQRVASRVTFMRRIPLRKPCARSEAMSRKTPAVRIASNMALPPPMCWPSKWFCRPANWFTSAHPRSTRPVTTWRASSSALREHWGSPVP